MVVVGKGRERERGGHGDGISNYNYYNYVPWYISSVSAVFVCLVVGVRTLSSSLV